MSCLTMLFSIMIAAKLKPYVRPIEASVSPLRTLIVAGRCASGTGVGAVADSGGVTTFGASVVFGASAGAATGAAVFGASTFGISVFGVATAGAWVTVGFGVSIFGAATAGA